MAIKIKKLIDLYKAIPKDQKYYYDIIHYSNKGSILAANYIAKQMVEAKIIHRNK